MELFHSVLIQRRGERRGEGLSGPAACWLAGITVLWHRTITQNAHYETIPVGAVECQGGRLVHVGKPCGREFTATKGIFTSSWVNIGMYCSAKQLNRNLPWKKHQELKHDSSEESQRDQTARNRIAWIRVWRLALQMSFTIWPPASWLCGSLWQWYRHRSLHMLMMWLSKTCKHKERRASLLYYQSPRKPLSALSAFRPQKPLHWENRATTL